MLKQHVSIVFCGTEFGRSGGKALPPTSCSWQLILPACRTSARFFPQSRPSANRGLRAGIADLLTGCKWNRTPCAPLYQWEVKRPVAGVGVSQCPIMKNLSWKPAETWDYSRKHMLGAKISARREAALHEINKDISPGGSGLGFGKHYGKGAISSRRKTAILPADEKRKSYMCGSTIRPGARCGVHGLLNIIPVKAVYCVPTDILCAGII